MKPPRKRKLLQQLLISFFLLIAILTTVALFTRHIINKKLQSLLYIIENNHPVKEASNALLLLHQAENDFQLAVFSYNASKLALYKQELQQAFIKIDSIRNEQADTSLFSNSQQKASIQALYRKKIYLSDQIFALKIQFDSMLVAADRIANSNAKNSLDSFSRVRQRLFPPVRDSAVHSTATVVVKKRGFLKRVKDVFSKRADTLQKTEVNWVNQVNRYYADSLAYERAHSVSNFYERSLNALRKRQKEISAYQQNLLNANQQIMDRLKQLVNDLQALAEQIAADVKNTALHEYHSSAAILDFTGVFSLVLVLFFSVLLIWYTARIHAAERQLRHEHEVATSLAQHKTDLLATMSHEIRNPLNSVIGFLKELKTSGLTPQQAEMMDSIQLSSDMLLATVNDVLDMTKLESGEFQLHKEQFNPYNTLRLTTEAMRFSSNDKKLALTYSFTGNQQANVIGDTFRLKQILVNLLSNAIKFTSEGSVSVQASLKPEKDKLLLQVTVTDTGSGISKAQQARLFSKYYQASSSGNTAGSGLGLYICRKLVQLQKGSITVNSTPGKGSSFSFTIPYQPVSTRLSSATVANTPVNISVFAGKKILIADDYELNLKLINIMTQHWEITRLQAKDGKEAFSIFQEQTVDLVLTDLEMPRMNGWELVKAIRESDGPKANVPVVLITAYKYGSEELAELQAAGFTDYIVKPFNEAQLAQKLFAALQQASGQETTVTTAFA